MQLDTGGHTQKAQNVRGFTQNFRRKQDDSYNFIPLKLSVDYQKCGSSHMFY